MESFIYRLLFFTLFSFFGAGNLQSSGSTKTPTSTRKTGPNAKTQRSNPTEAPKEADLVKRDEMIVMARHLGVTCNYCHDIENFRDGRKPTYRIAMEHIEMVNMLNHQGFKGKLKSNCYMCHRGKAKPDYIEP